MLRNLSRAVQSAVFQSSPWNRLAKNRYELAHWQDLITQASGWYDGRTPFRFPFPDEATKEKRFGRVKNVLMTYIAAETEHASYRTDLLLPADVFRGMKVADVGSGPLPTLLVFDDCERTCIDHLMDEYRRIGYPLEEYEPTVRFVQAKSESIPLPDGTFDAVISRNALDHVDDFESTAAELIRILRPGGMLHLLLNYHLPTRTEPQAIDDARVLSAFAALPLHEVLEQKNAWGFDGGATVLWTTHPERMISPRQDA